MSFDPSAAGRRIHAALVLRGLSAGDVAPELNISARTLNRVLAGERQPREWELGRLAELLEVPAWFLREGFGGQPTPEEVGDERLAEITRAIAALDRKLDTLDVGGRLAAVERELSRLRAAVEMRGR